jgi:outer membrane protein assembly complex protein YaeT
MAALVFSLAAGIHGWSQSTPQDSTGSAPAQHIVSPTQTTQSSAAPERDALAQWQGVPVRRISFEGVDAARLEPLPSHLAQTLGTPLSPDNLRRSLRQLFATGLYETIDAAALPLNDGVAILFEGTPRTFIGSVTVEGAKGTTINAQLARAGQLNAGSRFTQNKLDQALGEMRTTLDDNGFHEPQITYALTHHPEDQLVDIAFLVDSGPQARLGSVQVSGDPGMSVEEFRRYAHLRPGMHVDHETANRALAGVLKHYRNQDRLEAEIKLESEKYDDTTKRSNFHFSATRGPEVKVQVKGVNMDQERIRHVIPIYEEGTVDEDLLNEGNRRIRDYYQRLGYFDVKVDHQQQSSSQDRVEILFNVALGPRRRVERVEVAGNHYFDAGTLKQLLNVHAADALDRHGAYSQALVSADISALQAVYQNNGFSKVKITPETSTAATGLADNPKPSGGASPAQSGIPAAKGSAADGKTAPLTVTYRIEEGQQSRVGTVQIEGNDHVAASLLTPLLNTTAGQLLSPRALAGDRDTLVTDYLSRGFEHPQVDVSQLADPSDPDTVNVAFHITEGQQVFVRKVLFTGLHYTRPETVANAITIHAGDPLNQTALTDTQRNLYEFALFNEVDTAVENPNGADSRKTVLLQAVEARRWALTYGFGFEAQTGTPHYNCGLVILSGAPCNTEGKTGVSPRVLLDITRNNLFGREQSASLQATYGLLEQKIDLLFQVPHFEGTRDFGLNLSGGYANSLDVTTYVASKLEAGMRWTEHFSQPDSLLSKANTFVYEFNFRRVKVQANSLQVSPGEISTLATAVRVGGPALTWIRDTRDSPLDAHRGTYTSFQEFLSDKFFGAQVAFNRLDVSNSNYWSFDKGRLVVARNTRYGQERAFGTPGSELIPLPERLYAGGPTSLRGFSINAAGPRDPETGFPIGGAGALINSTELRLPPPTLPFFGDSLSLVLFHDMGNIFANASDAWASALRVHQPNRSACTNLDIVNPNKPDAPVPPITSTGWQGECSFNYFSHALGLGLRYHTPAGPIRLDFSYNLNTPIFPVIYNYSNPTALPTVGEANHFNFFFSLGQTF